MIIESKRFGKVDVKEERIINLQSGMLGFPELKRFFLADDPNDPTMPFKWLVSVDDPEFTFLCTDPGIFFSDYVFDLSEEDRKKIGATSEDDVSVLSLLTLPNDPKMITANLRGPIVINWRTLIGRQVVLKDTAYTTKHYIFIQATEGREDRVGQGASSGVENLPIVTASAEVAKKVEAGAGN